MQICYILTQQDYTKKTTKKLNNSNDQVQIQQQNTCKMFPPELHYFFFCFIFLKVPFFEVTVDTSHFFWNNFYNCNRNCFFCFYFTVFLFVFTSTEWKIINHIQLSNFKISKDIPKKKLFLQLNIALASTWNLLFSIFCKVWQKIYLNNLYWPTYYLIYKELFYLILKLGRKS